MRRRGGRRKRKRWKGISHCWGSGGDGVDYVSDGGVGGQ